MRKITLSMVTLLCGLLLFTACNPKEDAKPKGKDIYVQLYSVAMTLRPTTRLPSLR